MVIHDERYLIRHIDTKKDAEGWRSIVRLDARLFKWDDRAIPDEGDWWVVYFLPRKHPVAYAGISYMSEISRNRDDDADWMYLNRCGVMPKHRGHGLQRKLIECRVDFARTQGAEVATSLTYDNPVSASNLIQCGFMPYRPLKKWGAVGSCFWKKAL